MKTVPSALMLLTEWWSFPHRIWKQDMVLCCSNNVERLCTYIYFPTAHFPIIVPINLLIDVSELHRIRQSKGYQNIV